MKQIAEFMTKTPHTIGPAQSVEHAKKEMYRLGIRHLPVLDGGRIVGILSDRDIKLAFAVEKDAGELPIKDVCSGEVYCVVGTTSLRDVCAHMAAEGIGSAIIVDDRERLVGIFTATDACRVLSQIG